MSLNLKKLQQIIIEETKKVLNEKTETEPATADDISSIGVTLGLDGKST